MERKTILVVIVLTSMVLLGIVGIQLYWIQNAVSVREENFNRSVNEAINNVIYKLEKVEAVKEIQRTMNFLERGNELYSKIDSANQAYTKEIEMLSTTGMGDSLYRFDSIGIQIQYLNDVDAPSTFPYDTTFATLINRRVKEINSKIYAGNEEYIGMVSPTANAKKHQKERIKKILKEKSSLINDVIEDMFNVRHKQNVERRIDFRLLDSLIGSELRNKNIETPYEFGIFSPRRNLMVVEKTGAYHVELMRKSFPFNLFPRELLRNPEFLMVYFPHEKKFLITQMRGILLVSAFLILAIIASFAWIMFTIFRQKKLSEMKNDFINNMTHEFKTPIATVSLACEALTDTGITQTKELSETYIHIIAEENKRLGTMAEKILQTAILEKGQLNLKIDIVDIHWIITEVIKNIKIQVEIKGGVIATDFHAENPIIQADRVHITNVMANLMDNANKYTPKSPAILVSTENTADGIKISINDNGIGISKANQKKIFEKLYRVSTGNIHDVKGFGLGLSYVKFIVEKHGGTVEVDSDLGKGSTFIVTLPMVPKGKLLKKNN